MKPTKLDKLYMRKAGGTGGFSLIELLVVIAVIGALAGISIPTISNVMDKADGNIAKRNAQSICELYNHAQAAGAPLVSNTKEGALEELIGGVSGTYLDGTNFQMSKMSAEEKSAALALCTLDTTLEIMIYEPEGGVATPQWGPWTFSEQILNSQLHARLDFLRATQPHREWRWVAAYPPIHNESAIEYRDSL